VPHLFAFHRNGAAPAHVEAAFDKCSLVERLPDGQCKVEWWDGAPVTGSRARARCAASLAGVDIRAWRKGGGEVLRGGAASVPCDLFHTVLSSS
jgi:hypothetical protein